MWYKIKNGEIVARIGSLPVNTDNVSGFSLLPLDELLEYGYRPCVDSREVPDDDHKRGEDIETVFDNFVELTCLIEEKTEDDIYDLKKQKCLEAEQVFYEKKHSDIEYMGHVFQADELSIKNIEQVIMSMSHVGSVPSDFVWRAKDNSDVPMSLEQVQCLAEAIGRRGWEVFKELKAKKDAINGCKKASEILAL